MSCGGNLNLYLSLAPIILSNGLYGYVVGINGNVVTNGQLLCEDHWDGPVGTWTSFGYHQCFRLSAAHRGWLSALTPCGAMLSALICFRFSEYLGRRRELLIAAPLYFLGALLAGLSPFLWGIYLGVLCYGLAAGFTCHGCPLYIAETSPASIRGVLLLTCGATFSLMMCVGYGFGAVLSDKPHSWRLMEFASLPFSLLIFAWTSYVPPESPRFLILKAIRTEQLLGKQRLMAQAKDALQFLRSARPEREVELGTSFGIAGRRLWPKEVEAEVETIRGEVVKSIAGHEVTWLDAFQCPSALLAGGGIMIAQQVTGQVAVLYEATDILKSAGFGSLAAAASLALGGTKFATTFVAAPCVDRYGRRFLLFTGCSIMAVSLMVMSVAFKHRYCRLDSGLSLEQCPQEDIGLPSAWGTAALGSLMLYIFGYQLGFGAVCWLIVAEVFPLRVRGAAMSLAAAVNFACSAMVVAVQPLLMEHFSVSGVFLGYMTLCLVSMGFVRSFIPETKGKTLEQIEAMMTAGVGEEGDLLGFGKGKKGGKLKGLL